MNKGFRKNNAPQGNDDIKMSSMVRASDGTPAVVLNWGKQEGILSVREAINHGFAVVETAIAAMFDALIMKWATEKLGIPKEEAAALLPNYQQQCETGTLPSMTINIGGEHLRPDTVRKAALEHLGMAFEAEAEGFLVGFLLTELDQSPERVDMVIQEFREMRGAVTMWPKESE